MNDSNTNKLDKILADVLASKVCDIKKQMYANESATVIYDAWSNCVGEKLSKHTSLIGFSNGVLSIRVFSSAVLVEISKNKKNVLEQIQPKFLKNQIKKIVFKVY